MSDVASLLEKATEALRRDLNHIFGEVSLGKLPPASSRDLVAYVKLLHETADREDSLGADVERLVKETLSKTS